MLCLTSSFGPASSTPCGAAEQPSTRCTRGVSRHVLVLHGHAARTGGDVELLHRRSRCVASADRPAITRRRDVAHTERGFLGVGARPARPVRARLPRGILERRPRASHARLASLAFGARCSCRNSTPLSAPAPRARPAISPDPSVFSHLPDAQASRFRSSFLPSASPSPAPNPCPRLTPTPSLRRSPAGSERCTSRRDQMGGWRSLSPESVYRVLS